MNSGDKELIEIIKISTIKKLNKTKVLLEVFPEDSNVRVSNFTRIIGDEYIRFHQPASIHKAIVKERIVIGKSIYLFWKSKCKFVIFENKDYQKELKIDYIWKIEKLQKLANFKIDFLNYLFF